jgi:hypothetical protein
VREVTDPAVAAALRELAREDSTLAEIATAALEALTSDRGLESITQHGLQEWLWSQLPVTFPADEDAHAAQTSAAALARLLAMVGLPRYATVCASETTRDVLAAYDRGESAGRVAYRRAMDSSGVVPPDVPELAWGDVMGAVDVAAYFSCAAALEMAIEGGTFAPGARGWRTAQQAATRAHLLRPRPDLGGECWLDRVLAERVERWLGSRGGARRELLAAVGDQLLGPSLAAPDDAAGHVAPVRWLLDRAADGVELTQTDRLRPAVVNELAEAFGWDDVPGKRRLEDDVVEVRTLRDLAQRIAGVRRSGRRLVLTATGRRLAGDPAALWQALATHLIGDGFRGAVEELALAAILTGTGAGAGVGASTDDADEVADTVTAVVTAAVAGEGWRDQDGTAPDRRVVRWTLVDLHWALEVLGLLDVTPADPPWSWSWRLNPAGHRAALAALRARATRPRRTLRERS